MVSITTYNQLMLVRIIGKYKEKVQMEEKKTILKVQNQYSIKGYYFILLITSFNDFAHILKSLINK